MNGMKMMRVTMVETRAMCAASFLIEKQFKDGPTDDWTFTIDARGFGGLHRVTLRPAAWEALRAHLAGIGWHTQHGEVETL